MNSNELNDLKPGPGISLSAIPETVEAVGIIEEAHAALEKTYLEILRKNQERRNRQELGVSIPNCELRDWQEWQSTALRRFHETQGELAGRILLLCDERLAIEAEEYRQREAGIGRGLGKMLMDQQAGSDLAGMLLRMSGGLPVKGELRDVRNRWHKMCRSSARILKELPPAPVPAPTASDYANELKTMIEKEG